MEKKKKVEIKTLNDLQLLEPEERLKYEIANEIGLFDKIVEEGWKSLSSKESGRIGGILSNRKKKVKMNETVTAVLGKETFEEQENS